MGRDGAEDGASGTCTRGHAAWHSGVERQLDVVRRRTLLATGAVILLAAAGTAAGMAADPTSALLPIAFILGWLNLAGQ